MSLLRDLYELYGSFMSPTCFAHLGNQKGPTETISGSIAQDITTKDETLPTKPISMTAQDQQIDTKVDEICKRDVKQPVSISAMLFGSWVVFKA